MKKNIKFILASAIFAVAIGGASFAEDAQTVSLPEISDAGNPGIVNVSNTTAPQLVAPVVVDPNANKATEGSKAKKSPKLDLRAVIFDPNADFAAQAKEENREMTKMEEAEENIHEALHGEVSSLNDMSKKGALQKYLTIRPEGGILDSLNMYTGYKGTFSDNWAGSDYKNTLYAIDTLSTTFEGVFKDKKTSFRSMYSFAPGKDGHDFFNDVWGDQYLQYAWTKKDQLLFGYKRNTFGIEGSLGPWVLPLINRSQIAKNYNNTRSLGFKAQGAHDLYEYSLEFSSSGRNFMDWFPGPEFLASFAVKPLGKTDGRFGRLLIGSGIDTGKVDNRYTIGTGYLDYEYKRWNATFEYASADGSNGSTGYTRNQSEGYVGTLGYRITPKWQIVGRYDQFDPNKTKKNDIRREYTVGLNYFIKDNCLKVQVDYTVYSIESGTFGSQIFVGTQIVL